MTKSEIQIQSKQVLVVEDVPIIQRMMRLQLGNLGAEVTIASTGAAALSHTQDYFDLILMDLNLPDVSGYDIIKQMRADPKHDIAIPIVIATTESYPDANALAEVAPLIQGYLKKPISQEQLIALLLLD